MKPEQALKILDAERLAASSEGAEIHWTGLAIAAFCFLSRWFGPLPQAVVGICGISRSCGKKIFDKIEQKSGGSVQLTTTQKRSEHEQYK